MNTPHRRLVTRRCAVCEWTGESVETAGVEADCALCHAPTLVVREEWLVDPAQVRAQAAEYGRQGGLKGGRIRAERLSATRRREIARKAAAARWRR
jgi:hypothetical protein